MLIDIIKGKADIFEIIFYIILMSILALTLWISYKTKSKEEKMKVTINIPKSITKSIFEE